MANNLSVSLNLMKMKAAIMSVKGKEKVKKCIVIPIEDNDLYAKVNEDGHISLYLNLSLWETPQSQYGDSHYVKQSHSKEWSESHSEEERRSEPILGNARPIQMPTLDKLNVPEAEVENVEMPFKDGSSDNDLPF